jgi:leucyl aminopeptidase (aminopeptidase T)
MPNTHFLTLRTKISEISTDNSLPEPFGAYFRRTASFLETVFAQYDFVLNGAIRTAGMAELAKRNKALFADILPENYPNSYADPAFAAKMLGSDFGKIFSLLYTELRCLIMYAHEARTDLMVIRMALFINVYEAFAKAENQAPAYEEIHQIIRAYMTENQEAAICEKMAGQFTIKNDFAKRIIMENDLAGLRYLYYFGEYITENELAVAEHLRSLPAEKIKLLADTYTEGYRIGFAVTGKDIATKKMAGIYFELGFERVIRQAVENFAAIGLESGFFRANLSLLDGRSMNRAGYFGADANKQYNFDHKDDHALVYDREMMLARLSALENAGKKVAGEAKDYAGPAMMMTFGGLPPAPVYKEDALRLSPEQQKLAVEFTQAAGDIINRYVPRQETSYTIIAFPTPEIGPRFAEIFDETVALNTLDYHLYRDIQQRIIDALDQAEYVRVTGCGDNKTDLMIAVPELADPVSQTNFENCVADVNIPVGEVFTSPKLKGTKGTLHVTRVFLSGLEYTDLTLKLADGMITAYDCANFASEDENKKLIKENILFHHDSLPVSEFAIGTNTTAYMVGKKYGIAGRFPILIAEKTGPHFAFGDTCYAHSEEVAVFNPDGKEIIARDNEISNKRKTDGSKAYFNCHTDVTIPYDELGEIIVHTKSGAEIPIFYGGKFVLPGCEELNRPLSGY